MLRKKLLLLITALSFMHFINAQTLFTYGKKTVSKTEFLKAFDKNPSPIETDRTKALNEYLNLYINYKLKVQSAYDDKMHEQPMFKNESNSFKKQLEDKIINTEANIDLLIKQAFERSQKDIHVAQIFIEIKPGVDNIYAISQMEKAEKSLKQGMLFEEAVKKFSNDDFTIQTNGDLGYITAFTLPYEFENEIYNLKVGAFSSIYKSSFGYHIFKNLGERNAVGKRKVAQVLLSIPLGANNETKQQIEKLADSIYHLAVKGEDFEDLVDLYSNDRATASIGGVLQEFGIGEYSQDFEKPVFELKQKGEISKPFLTQHGWHIVKLLDILPVSTDFNDPVTVSNIKQQIESSDRIVIAKKTLIKKWMVACKYKKEPFDENEFLKFSDSAYTNGSLKEFKKIKPETILFSFAKEKVTAAEWAKFAKAIKEGKDKLAQLHTLVLLKEYEQIRCSEYYYNHLDEFYPSLKEQSLEFDEANLLFSAMDKNVWNKANEDTLGMKKYYTQNKSKYIWQPGISAIIITAPDNKTALEVIDSFKLGIDNWRNVVSKVNANILTDSSRFENKQLPTSNTIENKVGFISTPEKNTTENAYSFIYVTAIHNNPEQRSFDEARGFVTSDYQLVLEQKWINNLKKKYPIVINQAVWKTVK
jgi:peptidyl-prolyl cis-trans isomerase SurA